MKTPELLDMITQVHPSLCIRQDPGAAITAFKTLGVVLTGDAEYFYIQFEGPFGSRFNGFELLDPCGEGEYSLVEATATCRELFKIPSQFLVISTLLGNAVLILNTNTNEVFNIDFEGGLECLRKGNLPPVGKFGEFIRQFFLATRACGVQA